MGLNGFTEWLFSALLSWMQIIYNWFWSMLASGGQNEFMPWFSDNWIKIVLILLAAGLIIDYTIYLMRWQPYHIWLNALRRARGYVSRPFVKETAKPQYAGYRRVLEDVDGAQPAPVSARAPARPARDKVRVYEAETVTQTHAAARDDSAYKRPLVRPPIPDARSESDRQYMRPEPAAVAPDSAFVRADDIQDDYADDNAPDTLLDADGYVPESVTAPPVPDDGNDNGELMFSAPPTFARSAREPAPVYGRVYQSPGQPILPLGMDEDERRPQVELPGMDVPGVVQDAVVSAPVQPEPIIHPAAAQPAPQPLHAERVQAAQPEPVVNRPVQPAQPAPRPAQSAPARRPTPDGYKSRRARAQSAASVQPVKTSPHEPPVQPTMHPEQPVRPAQPMQSEQPARPARPVRSISVHETGATRDMDFDDDM